MARPQPPASKPAALSALAALAALACCVLLAPALQALLARIDADTARQRAALKL